MFAFAEQPTALREPLKVSVNPYPVSSPPKNASNARYSTPLNVPMLVLCNEIDVAKKVLPTTYVSVCVMTIPVNAALATVITWYGSPPVPEPVTDV